MPSSNLIPILFGFLMASIDVISLSILKYFSMGVIKNTIWLIPAVVIYSFQPIIFLKSLSYEGLVVMNLIWDLSSDILVTILGLFWFHERLPSAKLWGVIFAFLSLALFATGEPGIKPTIPVQ